MQKKPRKPKQPKKNGRPCPLTEERYNKHIEAHAELLEALHRYYIEFEAWDQTRSFNSSRRLYYWLMRMQKQVKTRLVQIKQFQNSREPSFDPEIYRNAYLARIAKEQQELEDEMKQEIEELKLEMGLKHE
jgi:hypothetical protein